ncbi:putative hydrolase of the HAD superfamily [Marinobacter segnicrescens]|uniref:Putative hydrolase of the HAD superfamily n=1 Tax=Marinobacter segnicrescens TaxID=430453 RepID=A0A1I0EMB3_9GAMM|nr:MULTISPECIES: GMP/IMP nucleotidase [Marinobacter]UZD65508.1 GMP/IMP nucleotidase [Marinobacter sp. AN1]SET46344.1 putative hydrolase of the HAD superfamily [Marinobacter segnicrescens]
MIEWSKADQVFLDMDGTLLDLHFDNHFWLEHLPRRYGEANRLTPDQARNLIVPMIMAERGSLNWYCTDYWSERLSLDITALKAEVGDRIAYRPRVKEFLQALRHNRLAPVILTNCHPDPLKLKLARTGLDQLVDRVISSHDLGAAKEEQAFWDRLQDHHTHHRDRAIMVDDSMPVLESARRAGIGQCLAILAPDSQQPDREPHPEFPAVRHFDEVLPALTAQASAKPQA